MPNKNSPQIEDEADFSSYLNDSSPTTAEPAPVSAMQELASVHKYSKRVYYLVIFFVILAVAQAVMLVIWNQEKAPELPAGYQLVTPPNQPAKIEPIK